MFWNRGSFSDLDVACASIAAWDAEPDTTVYFSVGKHANNLVLQDGKTKIKRTQETATWFGSLALDLDIGEGKPYQDQRAGWAALRGALQTIGLPVPLTVSSGNGIHCYWPLEDALPRDNWELISIALRLALQDSGVVIDTTKVHDPSMVLRPVGTHHKKQTPWKSVDCVHAAGPFALDVLGVLRPWMDKAKAYKQTKAPTARASGKTSAITAAVLNSNDVDIELVAMHCPQVRALVESGGVLDAAGAPVLEPMWRASLGLAKHALDPEYALVLLAGQHADFNFDASVAKMSAWRGSGPTTCLTFEQNCAAGCSGCAYKGKVKSPAALSFTTTPQVPQAVIAAANGGAGVPTVPQPPAGAPSAPQPIPMPPGYVIARVTRAYPHVCREDHDDSDEGSGVTLVPVAPYEIYVTAVFTDPERNRSTASLLVNYPHEGWKEFDMPLDVLATNGKEFVGYMLSKLIVAESMPAVTELRRYLMRYIDLVQQQAAVGVDFDRFGWQPDGSFLCGDKLLGSPTGNAVRKLSGPARHVGEHVVAEGSRDKWIEAMAMLDEPCANNLSAAVLLGTAGILGKYSGNSSFLVSIYSTETTTGKSLALAAVNSMIGRHKHLLLGQRDTANAVYKIRGVLNQLPATMDELTMQDGEDAVNLAYNLSQGREKLAMTQQRDLRTPVTWDGPTLISTNHSMHQKFDEVMSQADPVKARTLELFQHDREFISGLDGTRGTVFYNLLDENHGWAFPELVQGVIDAGGAKVVWESGERGFEKTIGFKFEPQERFYRSAIVSAWIMGRMGKALGLFPFDVDRVTKHLCSQVKKYRQTAEESRQDAFDIIGQFLQEHNDRIVVCREQYAPGTKPVEQLQHPVPELAVARIKIVYDAQNPVMPGSVLSINHTKLRKWLTASRDSVQRVSDELLMSGALVAARERVTIYKGCARDNPGQAICMSINLAHPRFVDALTSAKARPASLVTLAVLKGMKA